MSKISKKERGEMVSAGRACAEKACTDETDVATANDVIEYPESYAEACRSFFNNRPTAS